MAYSSKLTQGKTLKSSVLFLSATAVIAFGGMTAANADTATPAASEDAITLALQNTALPAASEQEIQDILTA